MPRSFAVCGMARESCVEREKLLKDANSGKDEAEDPQGRAVPVPDRSLIPGYRLRV